MIMLDKCYALRRYSALSSKQEIKDERSRLDKAVKVRAADEIGRDVFDYGISDLNRQYRFKIDATRM